MPLFPITFSIHASKVCPDVPAAKSRKLALIVPGDMSTYVYDNERDYYRGYQDSYFAITKCKGGWDCMRHYEILANGCIPVFLDLEKCPPQTLALFPKQLVKDAQALFDTFAPDSRAWYDMYTAYARVLLDFTRQHLTNHEMARYVMRTVGASPKRVLYLSGCVKPDYQSAMMLAGFKDLFGKACHDYPRMSYVYKDFPNPSSLYGRGISYTNLVNVDDRDAALDETVENDIRSHAYDLIVYGSMHRGMPFLDLVRVGYQKHEVVMICGEDIHECIRDPFVAEGWNVFVREI